MTSLIEAASPVARRRVVLLRGLDRWLRTFAALRRAAERLVWPKADLVIRLWLAKIFFVSGLLKLTNWSVALDLATYEYPVSWMSPLHAAVLGAGIETVGGVLLAIGFMTRYAAVPMLVLSLVIQFCYLPFDSQLYWALAFGWYAVVGASTLSLDGLLRRGLSDSALPWLPGILRASQWVRERVGPGYRSALRVYLGLALLGSAGIAPWSAGAHVLPLMAAATVPASLALVAGGLLLAGLGTRACGAVLLLAGPGSAMLSDDWSFQTYAFMGWLSLLLLGPGPISVDGWIEARVRGWLSRTAESAQRSLQRLPRVVIVGAGFGGVRCAMQLAGAPVTVTLIDRANYHLFQPLLYQVATAGLSPGDIATPIRPLFREAPNVRVVFGTVSGVDMAAKSVCIGEQRITYDFLVLATGATHSYFGKDQWAQWSPGLKRIEDATEVRRRILTAFERAEESTNAEERRSLLTFLIVGGGPTGVELAGAIAELARHGMEKDFRNFDPAEAQILLVQSGPRLLPAFPEALSSRAQTALARLGVSVLLGSRVEDIDAEGVRVSGRRIASRTVLWAAGVQASPAASWLNAAADNAGRIKVGEDLRVQGFDDIYAIGDTALSMAWQGQPVPGLAPAAKQGGAYVARVIRARVEQRPLPRPFRYRHLGSLATIGRKAAVADFGAVRLWGAPAWWLWGVLHVGFLVGVRNRVSTMVNWFWSYLTFGGGIRLITGTGSR